MRAGITDVGQDFRHVKAAAVALAVIGALLRPGAVAQSSPAHPEHDREFAYGAETDFNSVYVWRGLVLNNRPVIQPSAWISLPRFTLSAWSNLALANPSDSGRVQTTYLALTHGRDWNRLRIEPAIEAYLNGRSEDAGARHTIEGSLKLSCQAGPLRIFTMHAFDVLAYRGSYFGEAGIGYEGRVTKKAAFAVSIRSGWASSKFNEVYIGLARPAFNFAGAEGSLTYYPNSRLYIRPHFEFSHITDRRLREYLWWPTITNFGLAVGFEF